MTTRIVGQNYLKNSNTTSSRRNKDRKKDRDRDREKDRDSDRDNNSPNRKNINTKQSQNIHYEDLDYSSNNNNNNNPHHLNYNVDNIEKNVDQSAERSNIKHSKGFILNKPYGVWPFHSNKEINSYYGNKTEPKYYLGNYHHLPGIFNTKPNITMYTLYVGTLISGTHCSRIFSDCDKKACRLQSPNYPGVYPRNLTCYYAIRQVIL